MPTFGIALALAIFAGMAHNLLCVSLVNAVAGSLFMAAGYWYASKPAQEAPETALSVR